MRMDQRSTALFACALSVLGSTASCAKVPRRVPSGSSSSSPLGHAEATSGAQRPLPPLPTGLARAIERATREIASADMVPGLAVGAAGGPASAALALRSVVLDAKNEVALAYLLEYGTEPAKYMALIGYGMIDRTVLASRVDAAKRTGPLVFQDAGCADGRKVGSWEASIGAVASGAASDAWAALLGVQPAIKR